MKLFKNNWRPKKIVVIIAHIGKENTTIKAIYTRYNNSAQNQAIEFQTIEELIKHFGASKAYWLHINGTGVLNRLANRASGYKEELIVSGDKDEFYFSSFTDGEKSAVSFVRKNTIASIEEALTLNKAHLIGTSCGAVPYFALMNENDRIDATFILQTQNGRIHRFERNEKETAQLFFHQQYATSEQLLAAAILHSTKNTLPTFEYCLSAETTTKNLEEYEQHRKFNTLGLGSIAVVFTFVVGNYFYINHLNTQTAQLEENLLLSNENLSMLDRLEQEKNRKEQLVHTSGFLGNKFISFYLSKIGESVPETIALKYLCVFPLTEQLKERRKVTVDTKKIEIEGFTKSSLVFDDWIEKMNRFEWVESVEVINYSKINESQAEFKLQIVFTH